MLPYIFITQLSAGPIIIQTWGFFAVLGFIAALWISLRHADREGISRVIIWDIMIVSLLGMIVGSRIMYFLSYPDRNTYVLLDPHGGFSLLGGAVMAGVLGFAYLKSKKQNLCRVFDLLTPGIVISLVFVRIGCFLVSDHIGRVTALPWGEVFPDDGSARHPVALYHIFFLSFISLIIFRLESRRMKAGALFFCFCVLYAVLIFIADLSRCNDLPVCDAHWGSFTYTQWALLAFLFLSPFARKFFISAEKTNKP